MYSTERRLIRGVYILKICLRKGMEIRIGALGPIFFRKGFYAYTGSAMGGLEARIRRHLRSNKMLHWHIDYLLQKAETAEFCIKETCSKEDECKAASVLMREGGAPITDFGSSDCRCKSHLFYFNAKSGIASNNKTGVLRDFKQIPLGKTSFALK